MAITKLKVVPGVAHYEEQNGFPVAERVKLQFVILHEVTEFFYVKGRQSGTAANKYGFGGLSAS